MKNSQCPHNNLTLRMWQNICFSTIRGRKKEGKKERERERIEREIEWEREREMLKQ